MSTGITGRITKSFSLGGTSVSIPSDSQTADTMVKLETTVSPATSNFHRILQVPAALIKMMSITSNKAVTIKTNSSGAPDQTLSIGANQGLVWSITDVATIPCPITDDITDVYISNAGADEADVKFNFLIDQPGVGS
jgi:hypothetical protein